MEKNVIPEAANIKSYLTAYSSEIGFGLSSISNDALAAAYSRIKTANDYGGTIFVAGNGGSAAISEHLLCDFMKGSNLRVISLCSNLSLLTALSNDIEYVDIFAAQLKMHKASSRDCLILISSSGNSPNIIRAAEHASKASLPVIGLTGFSGGRLKKMCDVSLHIYANNYGVIEDSHSALMHVLSQWHIKATATP